MSNQITFNADELEDLQDTLAECVDMFPKVTVKFMKSQAVKAKNLGIKIAKRELNTRGKALDRNGRKTYQKGSYLKGMKNGKIVYEWNDAEYNIRVYNSAPHAHLIEYGHRIVTHDGRDTGKRTRGFNILEKTGAEYSGKFEQEVETVLASKLIEELYK